MDVMEALVNAGAVDDGSHGNHYVYKSKKHGPAYINMDMLFPNVEVMDQVCAGLIEPFLRGFDTVVGAATGGIPLAVLSGYLSGARYALWADKDGDDFAFSRAGFGDVLAGRQVLIVEDLLTTGGTVMKVASQIRQHDGEVVGISCVCNRAGMTSMQLGVPLLRSLVNVNFEAHLPEHCQQCVEGVPIVTDVGHGDTFARSNPDYPGKFRTLLS
ncbi:MAG: orotate phosphoribosyltransferase [Candidatus Saccharibacteria bacterium]|nr:orotate phosphoribosyltransferase [Candidatus Saccharibacteria bacterium]